MSRCKRFSAGMGMRQLLDDMRASTVEDLDRIGSDGAQALIMLWAITLSRLADEIGLPRGDQ